jgi:choline dehydrogenase
MAKSQAALARPDILTYWAPAFFRGFFRGNVTECSSCSMADFILIGFPQELADNHDALSATILKAHPSSRGTVQLTGAHPQDKLFIQKQHFQAAGGLQDVADLRNAIKAARALVNNSIIKNYVKTEAVPGSQYQTDTQIETYVYDKVFGNAFGALGVRQPTDIIIRSCQVIMRVAPTPLDYRVVRGGGFINRRPI